MLSPKLGDNVVVKVDGKNVFEGKMLLSAAANAKFYGGGYKCAPFADVSDGLIDLVIVKKISIITFARLVKFYKDGEHLNDKKFNKYVTFVKGKDIEINAKNDLTSSYDGEVRHNLNYHIKVSDIKVNFILPSAN
jgi:diacylglycerol kinase family enzyme